MTTLIVAKHIVFTLNMIGLIVFAGWCVCKKIEPALRDKFIRISVLVLLIKCFYILLFVHVYPARVFSTDGERYFYEIQGVAQAPWEWNPIEGKGPRYSASAKMGMSYAYGLVLFAHRIDSLYGVLFINLVCGFLTCLFVMLLVLRLSWFNYDAIMAFFITGIYPETIFWNSRVVRENFTLMLVPLLVYASIRLWETHRIKYFLVMLGATFMLVLARAQLSLLFLLIIGYVALLSVLRMNRPKSIMLSGALILAGFLSWGFVKGQIKAAIGAQLLGYFSLNPGVWVEKINNFTVHAPELLSVFARQDHGMIGILIAPLFISALMIFIAAILNFPRIFSRNPEAAGLLVFLVVSFVFSVAASGLINIRFRATIAPLVVALISVTIGYYLRLAGVIKTGTRDRALLNLRHNVAET